MLGEGTTALTYYQAQVKTHADYYPFGMEMEGRTASSLNYRYGFNGKEKDASGEFSASQTHYDYGFRIYNPVWGKFLSVDPLTGKYPDLTTYGFAGNCPIWLIDKKGQEPDRNQAGTIDQATKQWERLSNVTAEGILQYIQSDPNAVRYIYTENRGWIDLQHYFGTLQYGKLAMDLLEPASGSYSLQATVFGDGANDSYYSYEDLPSNQFASEASNLTNWKDKLTFSPLNGVPIIQSVPEYKTGSDLIMAVSNHFTTAQATIPEQAPNWELIPFRDHAERRRLPEISYFTNSVQQANFPIYYSEEEKRKLLNTGLYVPQNHTSEPYNLVNFPAAPSSLQNGNLNLGATGH
jgi:RHS repeat-associated protein